MHRRPSFYASPLRACALGGLRKQGDSCPTAIKGGEIGVTTLNIPDESLVLEPLPYFHDAIFNARL